MAARPAQPSEIFSTLMASMLTRKAAAYSDFPMGALIAPIVPVQAIPMPRKV